MKRMLLLCIAFCSMNAVTNQELFLRANKEFHAGNYGQALKDYQAVTHKASAVLYNMGICLCKSGDFAQALAYFKRAARSATRSTVNAILENGDRVERILQVYKEPTVREMGVRFLRSLVAGTSLLQWQIMLLLVLYMSLLGMWRSKKRLLRILLWFFVILCFIGLVPILVIKWTDEYVLTGIVLPQSMVVYSGPYHHCHQQGTLTSGHEVTVKQKQNGWYKIQYDTIIGWIPEDSLAPTI